MSIRRALAAFIAVALGLLTVSAPGYAGNAPGVVTEFPTGGFDYRAIGIASDRKGNMWFTVPTMTKIGKVTQAGTITYYDENLSIGAPWGIALGPDGNMWFTEFVGNKIGKITPEGTITEYDLPGGSTGPWGITAGPQNSMWATLAGSGELAQIDVATAAITIHDKAGIDAGLRDITADGSGNLWFSEYTQNEIGQYDPSGSGTYTSHALSIGAGPTGITMGPDGRIWFAESGLDQIGALTTGGVRSDYPAGVDTPQDIATGADGRLWFTSENTKAISAITTAGVATIESSSPSTGTYGIAANTDGDMWFTLVGYSIGKITTGFDPAGTYASLTGSGVNGTDLTCTGPTWSSTPVTTSFSWQRDGVDIPGQTAATYTVTADDVTRHITCTESALLAGMEIPLKSISNSVTGEPHIPSAPQNISVVAGDASVQVSWQPPADNGGAEIDGYVVTATPGGATCTTSGALSCTVTGLTNGTSYTFAVAAHNPAGYGPTHTSSAATPQGNQKITFTSKPPKKPRPGLDTYTVTATGGASGNPVVFAVTTPKHCSISGSVVSFVSKGTCKITANQAGNEAYLAAPQATQQFKVAGLIKQKPRKPLNLPKKLASPGLTKVVRVPVVTNAGQNAKVRITGRTRAASVAGETRPFVVIRKDGYLWVKLSGTEPMRVTVRLRAKAVPGYTDYQFSKVYKTKG